MARAAYLIMLAFVTLSLLLSPSSQAATDVGGRLIPDIEWDTRLEKFQFDHDKFLGQRFTAMCPPAPKDYSAGTNKTETYPSRNAICDAGFRAGAIDKQGGVVTVQLNPGMSIEESRSKKNVKGTARTIIVLTDVQYESGQRYPARPLSPG